MAIASFRLPRARGAFYGLGRARATCRVHLANGPVLVPALLASRFLAGVEGAAWALAAVEAVVRPVWIMTFRRTLTRLGGRGQVDDAPVPVELPIGATPATRDGNS